MSGRKSRRKGYIGEYKARKKLESLGFEVTWQAEDPKKPDIRAAEFEYGPATLDIEVKYSAAVPKTLYKWFEEKNADALLIKRVSQKDGRSYPWLLVHCLEEVK